MTPAEQMRERAAELAVSRPIRLMTEAECFEARFDLAAAIRALPLPEEAPPLPAILAALPHLTGDELRRVAEAMPRVAGEWEDRERWGSRAFVPHGVVVGQRPGDNDCADWAYYENAYQALDAYAAGWTPELPYEASTYATAKAVVTWHPTARAAQAACDARLRAAGVALCGEVVTESVVVVTQPVGGCDGSGEYYYDSTSEDGRGARRPTRCPGCRACQ